ncbi:Gustatory receptor 81e [Halyomorpha halys]|nr:Gustatory receptor 81e [Halyomorpha halys]
MSNIDGIEKSFLRISRVSKWFGLFPLTINNDGLFQVSFPQLVISFLIIVSDLVLVIIGFEASMINDSWVYSFVSLGTFSLYSLCPLVSLSELFIKLTLKQLNQSIPKLKQLLRVVFPLHTSEFSHPKTFLFANIVLLSIALIIYVYFLPPTIFSNYVIIVSLLFEHILIIIILGDRFSGFVGIITSLFRLCNHELELLPSSVTATIIRKLERLCLAHDMLCDCATMIAEIHSFQILLFIFLSFFLNVLGCYNFICEICRDSGNISVIIYTFCIITLYCNLTWRIVDTSERCKCEAKKFNTLLYQLMIDDKTNEISENKKLRLHISMKREVVFSACGFFNLDYTLIHSMVAAATTYLVILIQFGQPMNNEVPPEHLNATLTTSSEVSNFFTTPSWIYTTI